MQKEKHKENQSYVKLLDYNIRSLCRILVLEYNPGVLSHRFTYKELLSY